MTYEEALKAVDCGDEVYIIISGHRYLGRLYLSIDCESKIFWFNGRCVSKWSERLHIRVSPEELTKATQPYKNMAGDDT